MKKKRLFTAIIASIIAISLAVTASAVSNTIQATLTYRDIKITLNGTPVTTVDANGNSVEPFIMDGTTYLPVRAVSEALGLDVFWEGSTSTVKLNGASESAIDNAEVRGMLLLDQISEDLYTLGWEMYGQLDLGVYSPTIFQTYWTRFVDIYTYYDTQRKYMPDSTSDMQLNILSQVVICESLYHAYVDYCGSHSNTDYEEFVEIFGRFENAYTSAQTTVAVYITTTFPVG